MLIRRTLTEIRSIHLGDQTLSVLEIWGAEYQENDALLLKKEDASLFHSICHVHAHTIRLTHLSLHA
jgi:phosphoribosylformylglycinamidine (FGAM) synthase-like enzyme